MPFEPKVYTQILERMTDRVVGRSELTDLVTGGAVHTILSAVAREIDDVHFQMIQVQDIWDIDSAVGDELDQRAGDLPISTLTRNGATKATTTLVWERAGTAGTLTIPAGATARVSGGGPVFITTAATSITPGNTLSGAVAASAVETGSASNTDPGTITQPVSATGVVGVTNTTAAAGGQDEETDSEFRERIRTYISTLPRGTEQALVGAVLGATVDGFGTIRYAQVQEWYEGERAKVALFIDDGGGTASTTTGNLGTPETITASAAGGERRFNVSNIPTVKGGVFDLSINSVLVPATDYRVDTTTGLVILDETAFPDGLTVLDLVEVEYEWYTGLIAEAQKIINGDSTDWANYPGYKALGTQVFVLAPTVTNLIVQALITPDPVYGGDIAELRLKVKSAILRYVNSLGIGDSVLISELYYAIQSVPGVHDAVLIEPPGNVAVGSSELARINITNIDLT